MDQSIDEFKVRRSALSRLIARCGQCSQTPCAKRDEYNKDAAEIDQVLKRYGEPYQGSLREMADRAWECKL